MSNKTLKEIIRTRISVAKVQGNATEEAFMTEVLGVIERAEEKETPKKPILHTADVFRCPNCNVVLPHNPPHCGNCGQAIEYTK